MKITYIAELQSSFHHGAGRWRDLRAQWDTPTDGRDHLLYPESDHPVGQALAAQSGGTSRFDPALADLLTHWYTRPGATIVDPFAGGPVRGVVATTMGRAYHGVDIDPRIVAHNRAVSSAPVWEVGDAAAWQPPPADAVITCPPYGPLERYTDDPRDLSTMSWEAFESALTSVVCRAVGSLHPDRYSVWVVSDIRHPRTGELRDLPGIVTRAHQAAGALWVDDLIIVDPIGANRLRAKRPFIRSRITLRTHQRVLVFATGDRQRAAWRIYDHADLPGRDWAGPKPTTSKGLTLKTVH